MFDWFLGWRLCEGRVWSEERGEWGGGWEEGGIMG